MSFNFIVNSRQFIPSHSIPEMDAGFTTQAGCRTL